MTHKYYKIKNTIIHLNSIRTVSLSERENKIYITYKTGDTRTEVIYFSTLEAAQKEFTNIENMLGVFTIRMITIKNLNTTSRRATIDIDYEEALCLLNSLYQLSKFNDIEKDENFNEVYSSIIMLHSLLKHSHIPDWELQQMYKLTIGNKLPEEK